MLVSLFSLLIHQALIDDGHHPDEFIFDCAEKSKTPPTKRASIGSKPSKLNGEEDEEENGIASKKNRTTTDEDDEEDSPANDANKANAENDVKNTENSKNCVVMCDAVGEVDDDQDQIQLTMADSDKLDTSNVDNEDSLNLTIGEDEAKIFQDVVITN